MISKSKKFNSSRSIVSEVIWILKIWNLSNSNGIFILIQNMLSFFSTKFYKKTCYELCINWLSFSIESEKHPFSKNPCKFRGITSADMLRVLQNVVQFLQNFIQFQFLVRRGRIHFSLITPVLFIHQLSYTFLGELSLWNFIETRLWEENIFHEIT